MASSRQHLLSPGCIVHRLHVVALLSSFLFFPLSRMKEKPFFSLYLSTHNILGCSWALLTVLLGAGRSPQRDGKRGRLIQELRTQLPVSSVWCGFLWYGSLDPCRRKLPDAHSISLILAVPGPFHCCPLTLIWLGQILTKTLCPNRSFPNS